MDETDMQRDSNALHAAKEVELTILMPCLNERETLPTCIQKARAFLDRTGIDGEVLIADNGSIDGSQAIAESLGARVVDVQVRGYGAALWQGILAARGKFTIMGDSDDSYDFASLDLFVERLRVGYDLVMGNRFKGGIKPEAMPPLHRYLGNPVLSFLGRLLFKSNVGDFHCGLRGFRTAAIRKLQLSTTGMEFASEMVVYAALGGLKIAEVPTTLGPDGRSRPPHLRTWRDGWRHLKFLLMHSPKWLFIIPGCFLAILGAVLACTLISGPMKIGSIEFDLNTFVVGCFLILLGVQIMTFGLIARTYATVSNILPRTLRAKVMADLVSVDRLALVGASLAFAGFGLAVWAFYTWAQLDFGPIRGSRLTRLLLLGSTISVAGMQLIFSSFFLGILLIPRRDMSAIIDNK